MEFRHRASDTEVHWGRGRRHDVGEVVARHGDDALVVTTNSAMQDAGYLDDVLESLDEADVEARVHEGVRPNPSVEDVLEVVERGLGADVVLGFGGGSVIDVSKAAAVLLASYDDVPTREQAWEHARGETSLESALPVVAFPTTSGTGSHVDPWAVVSNDEEGAKVGFGSRATVPASAVVDADVLDEMPGSLAARTGFDAFCHLSEAFVSRYRDPLTDAQALRGVELVRRWLPDSVDGEAAARETMAVADTLAGYCETTVGVISTHALAHAVGASDPEVAHGEALAAVASEVAAYNVENGDDEVQRRYGLLADRLGEPVADPKLDAGLAVDGFDHLKDDVGLDVSLSDLGFDEDDVESLATNAAVYMDGAVRCNPVELSEEDLAAILEDAL
ncbi:MAG: iron-containing alcohol dehydrogenase [Halobacteriales archaeon]